MGLNYIFPPSFVEKRSSPSALVGLIAFAEALAANNKTKKKPKQSSSGSLPSTGGKAQLIRDLASKYLSHKHQKKPFPSIFVWLIVRALLRFRRHGDEGLPATHAAVAKHVGQLPWSSWESVPPHMLGFTCPGGS